MGFSEFWLQSKNGKQLTDKNLSELKKSDLGGNAALIRLFNIFDTQKANGTKGADGVLNKAELTSLFSTMAKAASSKGNNSVFEMQEAEQYLETTKTDGKSLKELGIKAADLFNFLSALSPRKTTVNNLPHNISLTQEEAQEAVITEITNDVTNSQALLMQQDNGDVSKVYNNIKEYFDSDLALSNVEEALLLQKQGAKNLYDAKEGKLSKREYFLQNREYLKKLMYKRLFRKDENTGLNFIDRNRGNLSETDFVKMMEDYINSEIDKINSIDSLKTTRQRLLQLSEPELEQMLKNFQSKAETSAVNPIAEKNVTDIPLPSVPFEFDSDEPMSFEEVFKLERNCEFSTENIEQYIAQKQKISFATGAFNKYQSFISAADEIKNNPSADQITELFLNYYINPELAKQNLEKIIRENALPVSVTTNQDGSFSLDTSQCPEGKRNNILSDILKLQSDTLKSELETILGGNIEDRMLALSQDSETAYNSAFGRDFVLELAQSMADDNKTFIQRYTGAASMTGLGITVVGGILCFTPLAPLGAGMVTVGNTLAIGGMVSESALGYTEALTRSELDEEEIKELSKTLAMNAAGFVVGFAAGKTGMKAFNKLIDKKLAETFKTEISQGNRAQALKKVFSNPEYLASFMEAAGVKLSADFIISYAGDLAMMGILDTNDNWQSLLQSNLIGIMAGMSGDLKDAARLGKGSAAGKSDETVTPSNGASNSSDIKLGDSNALHPTRREHSIDVQPNNFNRSKELDKAREILEYSNNTLNNSPNKELFLNEILALAEAHPEIPSEKIYRLLNNKHLTMSFDKSGNCFINDFEDVLNLTLKHSKYQEQLLDIISNSELDYNEIIYGILKNPKLSEIANATSIEDAINLQKEGILYIGKEKFDALNKILHGEESVELKSIREDFKNKTGVDLKFDNNINPQTAKRYADSVEQFLARYKEAGKKAPKEIYITNLLSEGTDGATAPYKYPDLICIRPSNNIESFNLCLFHESVHLTDLINKRKELHGKPVGTKLGVVDGKVKVIYNETEANELKELISNYVSEYAIADTNEFTAEFGAMILENKITIKEIELENGEIVNDIHINEPFTNLDGIQIEVTDAVRRDIEKLVDYYFDIGGQNYPQK